MGGTITPKSFEDEQTVLLKPDNENEDTTRKKLHRRGKKTIRKKRRRDKIIYVYAVSALLDLRLFRLYKNRSITCTEEAPIEKTIINGETNNENGIDKAETLH